MYSLFVTPTSATSNTGVENFLVGILFLSQENIDNVKKEKKWNIDNFNDVVLEKMEFVVKDFIDELKSITVLDSSFVMRKGYGDRKFFGMWDNPERYKSLKKAHSTDYFILKVVKLMQKTLNTNEVNIEDFVKVVSKNTDSRNSTISCNFVDEDGTSIDFYAIRENNTLAASSVK